TTTPRPSGASPVTWTPRRSSAPAAAAASSNASSSTSRDSPAASKGSAASAALLPAASRSEVTRLAPSLAGSTPRCRRSPIASALRKSPQTFCAALRERSKTRTLRPFLASSSAKAAPARPPPIAMASASGISHPFSRHRADSGSRLLPPRRDRAILQDYLVAHHRQPQAEVDHGHPPGAEGRRQEKQFDHRHDVVWMAHVPVRPGSDDRRSVERDDPVRPVAPKRRDDPVAHRLDEDVEDDQRPDGLRRRRDDEEESRQPRDVDGEHHPDELASLLVRAHG